MKRRVAALFFVFVLVITGITGCSNEKEKSKVTSTSEDGSKKTDSKKMGRYMEEKVELPKLSSKESILKILQNKKKEIVAYTIENGGNKKVFSYTLSADKWKKSTPKWLNDGKLNKKSIEISTITIGEDGNYYALAMEYTNKQKAFIIKATSEDKDATIVKIPYLDKVNTDNYYPYIQRISVVKNGNLVLYDAFQDESLLVFSKEGKKLENIVLPGNQKYKAVKNNIIGINEENNAFVFYNAESNKIDTSSEFSVPESNLNDTLNYSSAVKEDGTLLIGDANGIHRLQKNGTLWETMVDGQLNSMSMPTISYDGLYVLDGENEEYYVSYSTQDGINLMHYVFNKDISAVPENEISVYSLKENTTIRQAVAMFQSNNTDVKVNYVVGMNEGEGKESDYIRALNTELLAGNGADVIVLDGLPVDSYIEKGVLLDITNIIKPMEDKKEILTNISKSYHKNGKIYSMPTRIKLPVMLGKKEAIDASIDLKSIVNYIGNSNKIYSSSRTYQQLLNDFLALYSNDFIDGKELNKEKLLNFLKNIKIVAKNMKATEFDESNENSSDSSKNSSYFDIDTLFRGNSYGIYKKDYETASFVSTSYFDTMIFFEILKKEGLTYSTINHYFIPQGEIGINAASKKKEISQKFLQFVFSKDVQENSTYDGYPVQSDSLEEWRSKKNLKSMEYSTMGVDDIIAQFPGYDKIDEFAKLFDSLNQPVNTNQTVNSMITEQAIPYLAGEIDVDQAANAIEEKVSLYLSE